MAAVDQPKQADITGVDIAQPRVKRHIGANNINRVINAELDKWQADFDKFTASESKDTERVNDFERRIEALRGQRRNISVASARILSIVCNELARQLLCHGMDQLKDGRGLVTVKHLHSPGFENLNTYPLFRTLNKWTTEEAALRAAEQTAARDAEIARLTKELTRANKKLGKDQDDAQDAAQAPEEVNAEITTDEDDDESGVVNFRTYIGHLYTRLKSEEKYSNVRCANNVREYLSDIVVEFLDRISPMFNIMLNATKEHTISDRIVLSVLQILLTDGQTVEESFEFRETKVDHPDDRKKTKKDGPRRQIPGYNMVHTYGFKDDRFAPINELVSEKLGLFEKFSTDHKRVKGAPDTGKSETAKPKAKTGNRPAAKAKAANKPAAKAKAANKPVKPKNAAAKRPVAKA